VFPVLSTKEKQMKTYEKLAQVLVNHLTGNSRGGDYKDQASDLSGAYEVLNNSYDLGIADIPCGHSTPRAFLEWESVNGDRFIPGLATKLAGKVSEEQAKKICEEYQRAQEILDRINELVPLH
jgi:hypothetical protein